MRHHYGRGAAFCAAGFRRALRGEEQRYRRYAFDAYALAFGHSAGVRLRQQCLERHSCAVRLYPHADSDFGFLCGSVRKTAALRFVFRGVFGGGGSGFVGGGYLFCAPCGCVCCHLRGSGGESRIQSAKYCAVFPAHFYRRARCHFFAVCRRIVHKKRRHRLCRFIDL